MRWLAESIEKWPIDRLRPYERNARTHSDEQIRQIARSIEEFGFVSPILVGADGTIIAGHGRLEAARRLGMKTVPVIVLDHLTEAQRRALVIADNRLAELAGWDQDMLVAELERLIEDGFDVDLVGFSEDDLPCVPDEVILDEPDMEPKPRPAWILIATDELERAEILDALRRLDLANTRIETTP